MGPLRTGLTAAATALLAATSAAAQDACAALRPGWSGDAPASVFDETLALMMTPLSLALLVASAAAIRFRHQWGALIVTLAWSFWISALVLLPPDAARLAAAEQGCIGSPTLFIALVAAICTGMIVYTTGRQARPTDTET
ncbi:hypothetical protein ABMC89_09725 [Sulfitobacter sp. HNIBRBA3233]|uniref:hypothetical protein n=1 Tax=Sulfitobacter marinivivus TaxID=3158558 RepID=UPI0032E00382